MSELERVVTSRFSCGDEHCARRLANALLVAGLLPELHPPRLPGRPWTVVAPAALDASPDSLGDLQQAMADAAERAGAAFDGCDAEAPLQG